MRKIVIFFILLLLIVVKSESAKAYIKTVDTCKVRLGDAAMKILPDFIANSKIQSGHLRGRSIAEIAALKNGTPTVNPGKGYVVLCTAQTSGSTPSRLTFAAEFDGLKTGHLVFGYLRIEESHEFNGYQSIDVFTLSPEQIKSFENSTYEENPVTKFAILATTIHNILTHRDQTDTAKDTMSASSEVPGNPEIYFSWSDRGRKPADSELVSPSGLMFK